MNLEQIKQEKIKEAEELFLKLDIDYGKDSEDCPKEYFPIQPVIREQNEKKPKLFWTRLSINSNLGCIVE